MLKKFGYDGAYHDENISIGVLLENPLEYNLEATALVFSVTFKVKSDGKILRLEDFTFYIMDEANRLYNTQSAPYPKPTIEASPDDDEPMRQPNSLILTDFNHKFLFQDLRIAFYYPPYRRINIIELKH